jgi:hypothetical protein
MASSMPRMTASRKKLTSGAASATMLLDLLTRVHRSTGGMP